MQLRRPHCAIYTLLGKRLANLDSTMECIPASNFCFRNLLQLSKVTFVDILPAIKFYARVNNLGSRI